MARELADGVRAEPGQRDARRALRPECEVVLADDRADGEPEVDRLIDRRPAARRCSIAATTSSSPRRELYADLRRADRDGLDALVVVFPRRSGSVHAVRDRLLKAAAGTRFADRPSRAG